MFNDKAKVVLIVYVCVCVCVFAIVLLARPVHSRPSGCYFFFFLHAQRKSSQNDCKRKTH